MAKAGRRKGSPPFLMLRHEILDHPNYHSLSPRAVKLLIDVARQFRGSNNGDLCATYSVLKARGWTSNDQIRKGLVELLDKGFLIKTRQGRRPNVASLFALTWLPIDECGGKLEVSMSRTPSNFWKRSPMDKPSKLTLDVRHTVQARPPHGAMGASNVLSLDRHTVLSGGKS